MATFTDPAAFAAHVGGYGRKLEVRQVDAVKAAAKAAANDIKDAGAKFHIRGRSGRSAKLSARTINKGSTATIYAVPPGFWKLIEKGAKPHAIYPRQRGRRGGRKAVVVPGLGIFAHVHHPGTGSIGHPWEVGVAKATVSSSKVFAAEMVKTFTG